MSTTAEVFFQGNWTILVIVRDGHELAAEHVESLTAADYRKVIAFLARVAQNGPLGYTDEKSKKLTDEIFELKPTNQVRLPYFFDGRHRLVVTHGFTKKRAKTPVKEIRRSQELRASYLEERNRYGA